MKKPTPLGHNPCADNKRKKPKQTNRERLMKQKSIQKIKNNQKKKKPTKNMLYT